MNTAKNYYLQTVAKLMLLLCLFSIMIVQPIFASEENPSQNVVRIGSFEETYNVINEKGERSGYGYEYLQNIAGYAGWTYEYVNSNWDECFAQLKNGTIDILGGISYTDERAESMLFSDMPMGEEKYYIYTDAANTHLSAANLKTFDGKNIGVLKDHIPEAVLHAWEERYGIHTNHINISTTEDVLEMLQSHKIDCFVSVEESKWGEFDISPITNIGESNIYFAISKKRPDIKEALDSAMRRIRDDNPFYTDELYQRYLSAQSRAFLSSEEKEWLADHGTIRIGYLNNDTGVSMIDPSTGKMTGVIVDYVEQAKNCLQGATLEFELKGYDTRSEQLEALHSGEIDFIFHVSQNPYSAESNGFVLSDTVWTFNMAAITTEDGFNENEEHTVAVAKDNFALKAYLSYNYPQWEIVEYATKELEVKAVQNGEADCFVSNSGVVSNYIRSKKLHSIFLTKPANVSFAIQQNEPILLSIMNKTLMSISKETFSGAVISYSSALQKVTVLDFIQDNFWTVAIIGTTSFLLILFIILNSLRKSKRAEAKTKQSALQAMKLNQELEKKQQELQVALVEAQSAVKAKTTFLNNMSHDIRTPINGIVGMLSILEKSEDNPERAKDCLHKIDMSSQLLLSLINDVLDMAKLESDAVIMNNESVELTKVCDEVMSAVSFQAEEAGLTVTADHEDYSGVFVRCSSLHLKKVLMNLFTNSIKYNKPNGSIHTSMKTLERTEDSITIEFKISDTGLGMSEEFVKNKLFTPFVQADHSPRTSYKGTGLGMPIVKAIVEKMNGSITVESTLGKGSCFTVVLPFQIDHCEAKENRKKSQTADITGLNLLLVEDNELNAEIAQFMLTDSGANVVTVQNGLEALQKFEESRPGTFDAILMDVMMPVMDGLAATRAIRALARQDAKTIPIIAMTANVFLEDANECLEAGMSAHLAKPLEIEKVKRTICEQVANRVEN